MKKILILTVTAGNGHNACANAMKKQLESYGNTQVEVVEIIKTYSSAALQFTVNKGYCFSVSKLPKIYKIFYDKYRKANPEKRYVCAAQGAALSTVNGIYNKISQFKPNVIFCTHFYAAIALSDLKIRYNLPCKCIATILDYVVSPFWEASINIDYLTIPNSDFVNEFVFKGFKESKLLPFGIPCHTDNNSTLSKESARRKLDIDENTFTVLTMFGGGHWNGGFKLFKNILSTVNGKNVQIIVINGKNEKNFKKISKLQKKVNIKILNVGYTYNIPLYLSAADVAVTKCGGVSSSEMLNAELPMVVTKKIPAQEIYNLHYLEEKGAAVSFKTAKELKEILNEMFIKPQLLNGMRESALKLKTNAVKDVAEFILNLPEADYSDFKDFGKENVKKQIKQALRLAHRELNIKN